MPFDWRDYLRLARELAERTDEAALRSAISRAYYAAYGTARDRLLREGVPGDEAGADHRAMWSHYRSSAEDVRYYIGLDGSRLRLSRNAADYEAEVADLPAVVRRAVADADRILRALDRLGEDQGPPITS